MMNAPIIDPLQGDFPEVIEEYLEYGLMKCVAFNRRGTLLAAGCSDGSCVIWDFETRGIAKELRDKDCVAAVTSLCWSKYGHRILVSAADKSLILWDVVSGEKINKIFLQQTPLLSRLHPGSSTPHVCLTCPLSSAPMIVDLNTGITTMLPVTAPDPGHSLFPAQRGKPSDGTPLTPIAASFNKHGDLIYIGNPKGEILVVDHNKLEVLFMVSISGGAVVKNITFSRNGQYLLTNSSDRTIRIYENLLPVRNGLAMVESLISSVDEEDVVERMKVIGSKCLVLFREFQDSITKIQWKAPCFSGDGEWVIAGSASKGETKIYIWDRFGHLVKILEGPKEALIDLAWHPVHPIVVSVSLAGYVYIWAKDYTESWSAFAPDFKELEENEEYVEREDEFDLMAEALTEKNPNVNEDEEVDITTVENDVFSDSDMSQEELRFLPSNPSPDAPEQVDKQDEHFLKVECNGTNSPTDKEDTSAMPSKRKRKPSEKGLELQAEKVKKPLKIS